jgi:peptidoglycan/LPS O-acetylase OafA/YrhL
MKLGRIRHIDGLRGIAIGFVVIYHLWGPAYAFPLNGPSGIAHLPLVANGWVGVELFFIISGFVIARSITHSKNALHFIARRFARLFPAMAIASALILAFRLAAHPGPLATPPDWIDVLPGLTFVSPSFYTAVLGRPIQALDGVFWTLFVEMAFYITYGSLYFRFGARRAIIGLLLIALATLSARWAVDAFTAPRWLEIIPLPFEWAGTPFFLWFASGILFAMAKANPTYFAAGAITGVASALFQPQIASPATPDRTIALLIVVALFAAALKSQAVQRVLSVKPLLWLGFVSYPLYLVHATIGFGSAELISGHANFARLAGLAIVLVIAWPIAMVEPMLTNPLRRFLDRNCRMRVDSGGF